MGRLASKPCCRQRMEEDACHLSLKGISYKLPFPFMLHRSGLSYASTPAQRELGIVLFFFFFCLYHAAYGILVPLPGIKPVPSVLESRFLTSGPPEKFQLLGLLRGVGDTGSLISTSCHECSSHFPLFFSPPGLLFHCCTCL